MDARARLLVWRTGLLLRRAARDRRRCLARELASYVTQGERDDLMAAVDRCPHPGGEEVRRLLLRGAPPAAAEPAAYHRGR
jgi:hypothetical protein